MSGTILGSLVILLSLSCYVIFTKSQALFTASDFDYHVAVDGSDEFLFYWTLVNDTYVEIGVSCQNLGWCGLGISPNGQMPDSDIMFFWVDDNDGTVYLQDRYASGRTTPTLDESQDLYLIDGLQSDDTTYIRFGRNIYRCDDDDDNSFEIGTSRILYAFNENDPDINDFDNTVVSHGSSNMGYKSVNVLTGSSTSLDIPELVTSPNSVYSANLTVDNYIIPSDTDTTYFCTLLKFPETEEIHHIVAYDGIVTEGNEAMVHHIIMYFCPSSAVNESHVGISEVCSDFAEMPISSADCSTAITVFGWAIGGEVYNYPSNVGLEMSGTNSITDDTLQYVLLEIHYDNPNLIENRIDNSGLIFYYTSELRDESAVIFVSGIGVYETQFIPSGISSTINYGYCSSDCTSIGIPDGGITFISSLLHAHTAGIGMKLRHIRNGIELPPIDENQNYDFNYQTITTINVSFLPGDEMILECTYNTEDRSNITFGGLGTSEEMCLVFLTAYPKPHVRWCGSVWLYDQLFSADGDHYSWTETAVEDRYLMFNNDYSSFEYDASTEEGLDWYNELWTSDDYAKRYQACSDVSGNGLMSSSWELLSSLPTITTEYENSYECGLANESVENGVALSLTSTYCQYFCGLVILFVVLSCFEFVW